jgi:MFS family permease
MKGTRLIPGEHVFKRELITMYLAGFFQLSTVMISFTLVPLYVRQIGGGDFAVGVQTTLFALFSVLLRFILGPLADSRGRKLSLLIGSAVFATAPLGIWLSPNLALMALVRVYQAIGMATFLSAATSYVADHAPKAKRGKAIGLYRTAVAMSVMIAPAIGMAIINDFGYGPFFIYTAALGGSGTLLVITLPEKLGVRYEHGDTAYAAGEGVTAKELFDLFRIPDLRSVYAGIFALCMAGGVLLTYITSYAKNFEVISNPAFYFTIRDGIGAVAAVSLGALSDKTGRDRLILPVLIFFSLGTVLLAFMGSFNPLLFYYLSAAFSGIGFAGALALMVAKVVDAVPSRLRASALAFQESAIDGGNSVGIFIFGAALTLFSYASLFTVMAIFILGIPGAMSVFGAGGVKAKEAKEKG